jgi:glycosyltransferase involved in cell wall biosynthesis
MRREYHSVMRIALISTPFVATPPNGYGGTELVVHELAEALLERGHDVALFATGDSRTRAELCALYPVPQWPPCAASDIDHVSWAWQQVVGADRPFDVVHANSAVALACARLAPPVPLVYTIHHERDEHLSVLYSRCQTVQFVAISQDQRRREVPLRHVAVIHHGLSPLQYECVARVPGGEDGYVCFVGRLARIKGPHTAIEVAGRAHVRIRVAGSVHVVDEPWAAGTLEEALSAPHVSYLGPLGLDAKRALLRDARALLAPIEWNEPFGLALIESMLSGCPVVAYSRGSIPELVEPGVTGFIVRDAEDMTRVIRMGGPLDTFDRRRCRARAVERFSRDRMVRDYLSVYQTVQDRVDLPLRQASSSLRSA